MTDFTEFLKEVGDIRRVNMFTALDDRELDIAEETLAAKTAGCEHTDVQWERGVTSSNVKIGRCLDCGEQVERSLE